MAIDEADISILIPTYRYRDKVVRAVESALASGAGEIIVVDDAGKDGTIERLSVYSDPRLIVRENARNMGLWENHLNALNMATRPWIKFIQADDYLLPGGLKAFADAAGDDVTVVFGAPTLKDDVTGEVSYSQQIEFITRTNFADLSYAMIFGGWILGSPSHMMLRSSSIVRDQAAWRTTISSDLVVGSIAAARGQTVLLPCGAVGQGSHPRQDARTQKPSLGLQRSLTSLAYLRRQPEPRLRWLANMWAMLQFSSLLKTTAKGLVTRDGPPWQMASHPIRLLADLSLADWADVWADRDLLKRAAHFRRTARPPYQFRDLVDRKSHANV